MLNVMLQYIEKMSKQKLKQVKKKSQKEKLKQEYKDLKELYWRVDKEETLKKWKVLSKAYQLGKKIHGVHYTVSNLSVDFDIPYTTAKRILSLDRANEKTWKLVKEGKISAFKVAQICLTKSHERQDEIVELVVKNKLSTYQIKKLKIYPEDMKIAKLEKAMKDGFSRKDSAYRSLVNLSERLNKILELKAENFPEEKVAEIIKTLEDLNQKIYKKINEWTELKYFVPDEEKDETTKNT
jgi:hypothetical protein